MIDVISQCRAIDDNCDRSWSFMAGAIGCAAAKDCFGGVWR